MLAANLLHSFFLSGLWFLSLSVTAKKLWQLQDVITFALNIVQIKHKHHFKYKRGRKYRLGSSLLWQLICLMLIQWVLQWIWLQILLCHYILIYTDRITCQFLKCTNFPAAFHEILVPNVDTMGFVVKQISPYHQRFILFQTIDHLLKYASTEIITIWYNRKSPATKYLVWTVKWPCNSAMMILWMLSNFLFNDFWFPTPLNIEQTKFYPKEAFGQTAENNSPL